MHSACQAKMQATKSKALSVDFSGYNCGEP